MKNQKSKNTAVSYKYTENEIMKICQGGANIKLYTEIW